MTTTTFAQAANTWYSLSEKYAEFGASDTEPRAEFAMMIVALHDDREDVKVPATAAQWQLFSDMKGADRVARVLTLAAKRVVKVGEADRAGLGRYVRAQGWA